MVDKIRQPEWLCLGKSVRGSSHERSELPNQDDISWWSKDAESPELGVGPPLILAVSDGHGSPKNFRSDVGSQRAVATATRVIREFFLEGESDAVNFSTIKDKAQSILPQRLVHEWKESVEKDWRERPVTEEEEEWERVVQKGGAGARQAIEDNHSIAYGATLLAVLVTDSFILYLQLGDGDILCVDFQGNTTRPLERDPRLIANETTSLCTPNAWREFQVRLEPYQESLPDKMPALILVATDGYANSYPSEEEFLKIGRDYREMIWSKGIVYVEQQLEGFLKETSEDGSGDDITLGIIRRVEPGDWDYQDRDRKTQKKDMEQLSNQQKKTGKAVLLLLIGLIVTFPLALISTVLSGWLYFRLNNVNSELQAQEKRLDEVQNQIKQITGKPQDSEAVDKSIPSSGETTPDSGVTDNPSLSSGETTSTSESESTGNQTENTQNLAAPEN